MAPRGMTSQDPRTLFCELRSNEDVKEEWECEFHNSDKYQNIFTTILKVHFGDVRHIFRTSNFVRVRK